MNNYFNPFYRPVFPYQKPYYHQPNLNIQFNSNTEKELIQEPKKEKSPEHNNNDFIINIFGLQLHSDDILILLLIFFLYKENIDDKLLFIALFSLLF